MRYLFIVVALLAPVSALAQPPNLDTLVRQVAAEHPDLLRSNTNATCFRFVQYVLERANDQRWGHVAKTRGEGQFTPPEFVPRDLTGRDGQAARVTGVSHDAIYFCANPIHDRIGVVVGCGYSDADWQVDLLGNGNDGPDPLGSPARPQWSVIPPQFYRANNPWLQALAPSGGSPPPICPTCPTCQVCTPTPGYAGDEVFDAIAVKLFADYAEAGQAPNDGMGRWFGRVVYDWIAGVTKTLDESITKHRAEWRAILGLP